MKNILKISLCLSVLFVFFNFVSSVQASAPTVGNITLKENPTGSGNSVSVSSPSLSANGTAVSTSGIIWSTSPKPTTSLTTKTSNSYLDGYFPNNNAGSGELMNNLSPGTTYYVRGYAINANNETGYSNEDLVIKTGKPNLKPTLNNPDSVTSSTSFYTFTASVKNDGSFLASAPINNILQVATRADGTGTIRNVAYDDGTSYVTSITSNILPGISIGVKDCSKQTAGGNCDGLYYFNEPRTTIQSFRVCTDSTNKVDELDEGDNCTSWQNVLVKRAPDVFIRATPKSGILGMNSTLTWGSQNEPGSCVASDDWSGAKAFSGTTSVGPLNTEKVYKYTLTCSNPDGYAVAYATVTVSAPKTDGACAATHYSCKTGTSINPVAGTDSWTWSCKGINGGATVPCSEVNNQSEKPDLFVSTPVTPTSAIINKATTFSANVKNKGSVTTGASFINIFQTSTDVTDINNPKNLATYATTSTPALNAGSVAGTSKSITFTSAGTYHVRACADKETQNDIGKITESNEDNNCGDWTTVTVYSGELVNGLCGTTVNTCTTGEFSDTADSSAEYLWSCLGLNDGKTAYCSKSIVTDGPDNPDDPNNPGGNLPNLTASKVYDTNASVNTSTLLSASIINKGAVSTGSSFYNFFQIAKDNQGNNIVENLSPVLLSALDSGSSSSIKSNYKFPSTGNYYVRACADKSGQNDAGTITESKEDDNCSASWTLIAVLPYTDNPENSDELNLTFTVSPRSVHRNGTVTLNWTSNATSCIGTNFDTKDSPYGKITSNPNRTTKYTITCSKGDKTITKSAVVTVSSTIEI